MKNINNNPINSRVNDRLKTIKIISLGSLILLCSAISYNSVEESVTASIILQSEHQTHPDNVQQEIDQQLYDVFARFFDEEDTTPFSKTVSKIVSILKIKRKILHGQQLTECDELIKTFEKNKYNTSFPIWAKILITPELLNLMSPQTRTYINSLSIQVKINTLIKKLKK